MFLTRIGVDTGVELTPAENVSIPFAHIFFTGCIFLLLILLAMWITLRGSMDRHLLELTFFFVTVTYGLILSFTLFFLTLHVDAKNEATDYKLRAKNTTLILEAVEEHYDVSLVKKPVFVYEPILDESKGFTEVVSPIVAVHNQTGEVVLARLILLDDGSWLAVKEGTGEELSTL